MTVPSPCNRICTLDAADICLGCGRTIVEIMHWSRISDDERQRIVANAAARLAPDRADNQP